MSFKPNDYQQLTLGDSYAFLSESAQKALEKSWAKTFGDLVFPAIDEEKFSVLYSDQKFSRPNTPVNIIIGAMILKDQLHFNDDEMVEAILFDMRVQYALHTTGMNKPPVSDRTFSRFRERLYNYELETGEDLLSSELDRLNKVFERYMGLNSHIKRMDSLMIAANCKRMTRLEIVYTTVSNAVTLIHRLGKDGEMPAELFHYLDQDDRNDVIYYTKNENVASKLQKVIHEAELVRDFMEEDEWHEFSEYQILIRVLKEQTSKDSEGRTKVKANTEIAPDSLQNPSDPDATYRKKAGKDHKGYVGNIIETVGEYGDSLITGFSYETNTHSDSAFCREYLESRTENDEAETLIADGAYGGSENRKLAAEKNVNLITTALTGKAPNAIFAGFRLSEDGRQVLSCPEGHCPIKTTYYPKTGMCRALFPVSCCEHCPHREECRAKQQRKSFAVHVSANMVERAEYLIALSTEEYLKFSKLRNAIEGIPSVLRRRYHVDRIPVRGHLRSKVFFACKITAYNFNKLYNFCNKHRGQSALLAAEV